LLDVVTLRLRLVFVTRCCGLRWLRWRCCCRYPLTLLLLTLVIVGSDVVTLRLRCCCVGFCCYTLLITCCWRYTRWLRCCCWFTLLRYGWLVYGYVVTLLITLPVWLIVRWRYFTLLLRTFTRLRCCCCYVVVTVGTFYVTLRWWRIRLLIGVVYGPAFVPFTVICCRCCWFTLLLLDVVDLLLLTLLTRCPVIFYDYVCCYPFGVITLVDPLLLITFVERVDGYLLLLLRLRCWCYCYLVTCPVIVVTLPVVALLVVFFVLLLLLLPVVVVLLFTLLLLLYLLLLRVVGIATFVHYRCFVVVALIRCYCWLRHVEPRCFTLCCCYVVVVERCYVVVTFVVVVVDCCCWTLITVVVVVGCCVTWLLLIVVLLLRCCWVVVVVDVMCYWFVVVDCTRYTLLDWRWLLRYIAVIVFIFVAFDVDRCCWFCVDRCLRCYIWTLLYTYVVVVYVRLRVVTCALLRCWIVRMRCLPLPVGALLTCARCWRYCCTYRTVTCACCCLLHVVVRCHCCCWLPRLRALFTLIAVIYWLLVFVFTLIVTLFPLLTLLFCCLRYDVVTLLLTLNSRCCCVVVVVDLVDYCCYPLLCVTLLCYLVWLRCYYHDLTYVVLRIDRWFTRSDCCWLRCCYVRVVVAIGYVVVVITPGLPLLLFTIRVVDCCVVVFTLLLLWCCWCSDLLLRWCPYEPVDVLRCYPDFTLLPWRWPLRSLFGCCCCYLRHLTCCCVVVVTPLLLLHYVDVIYVVIDVATRSYPVHLLYCCYVDYPVVVNVCCCCWTLRCRLLLHVVLRLLRVVVTFRRDCWRLFVVGCVYGVVVVVRCYVVVVVVDVLI